MVALSYLFSVGCEILLPFTPTASESIGDSGKVPDLYDIFTCNFCHDRGDVDVNYLDLGG